MDHLHTRTDLGHCYSRDDAVIESGLYAALPGLIFGGLCVFFRFFAMTFVGLPFGYYAAVPIRIRVFLVMHISTLAFVALGAPPFDIANATYAHLLVAIINEVLLGIAMGLIVRLALFLAEGYGTLVSMATGLGFAVTLDPGTGVQSTALGRLANVMIMLLLLALNVHLEVLGVVFASFKRFQPGHVPGVHNAGLHIAQMGSEFIEFSLRLAAPVLMVSLIAYLVLAVITRVAPQLNLFAIGFPLLIVGGLMAMGLSLNDVAAAMSATLEALPEKLVELLIRVAK